ncbi:Coiled-coil domain-containing protein 22 [Balamuthia mandrillaris]
MEEADGIILSTLLDIGCSFSEDYKSVKELSPYEVAQSVLTCVKKIDLQLPFPDSMPRHMSQKVSLCSEVAKHIKDNLGYSDDLGYHQLLYPSENETRKLLRFLVGELPEEGGDYVDSESLGFEAQLNRSIQAELELALQASHEPPQEACASACSWVATSLYFATLPSHAPYDGSFAKYVREYAYYATDQVKQGQDNPASIMEHNLLSFIQERERQREQDEFGVVNPVSFREKKLEGIQESISEALRTAMSQHQQLKAGGRVEKLDDLLLAMQASQRRVGGKFGHEVSFKDKAEEVHHETNEELQARRKRETQELDDTLSRIREEMEALEKAMLSMHPNIHQIEAKLLAEAERNKELKKKYLVMKKTFDLLPDAENNIKLLQGLSSKSAARLVELAKEWEKHRVPLIEEYRKHKDLLQQRKAASEKLLEELKKMKTQMKEIEVDVKKKNQLLKALAEEYQSLPKERNRNIYTLRILDILKNVKKQKIEIDKILIDKRNLMKDISLISDTLNRTFAVIDELIYNDTKDKKKDTFELSKRAYQNLVHMNECFQELKQLTEDISGARNAVMEYETQIEEIQGRVNNLNIKRLEEDHQAICQENAKLVEQIKALKMDTLKNKLFE